MSTLQIHPRDNVLVALRPLKRGENLPLNGRELSVQTPIPAKHKVATEAIPEGGLVTMYGITVGRATRPIPEGDLLSTENVEHHTGAYQGWTQAPVWTPPDVTTWRHRTFRGYHRKDGRVGTANYWLVVPLVFCENRNLEILREALLRELGYARPPAVSGLQELIGKYRRGADASEILATEMPRSAQPLPEQRLFPNVDGIRFLAHQGGCGGTRSDAQTLCRLIAGYLDHPNVSGGTILSLGCQNAQTGMLQEALQTLNPKFDKPLYLLEHQQYGSNESFLWEALKKTFAGLMQANTYPRQPAPLSRLCLGLECGGSDGFSGISANPALGHTSDLLVALGGQAILAEFPELNGVEQDLIRRCVDRAAADKFIHLMERYGEQARAVGSSFAYNPSPGNIRDGLITDAMKSAGAARKGGSAPVQAVLDYTEPATNAGLHLLCTPGNDVESTTGLAGSGANIIVFTTGLGTPTGNPLAPTIKMSSNTELARRMADLIDIDAGSILSGEHSIAQKGEELLDLIIRVASGEVQTRAEQNEQYDFIPWRREISL